LIVKFQISEDIHITKLTSKSQITVTSRISHWSIFAQPPTTISMEASM